MDKGSYPILVIGAALIGAAIAVALSASGMTGPALDGGIGFGVTLWLFTWGNFRSRERLPKGW